MEREEITYPLGNSDFLRVLTNSFKEFIEKGTSRSTAKLKPLHGAIARDLAEKLGRDYTVFSQGYGIGKETKIRGRYVNKAVDITVKKGERAVAGLAVKFVMQNYSQNSNNYFENMLGETANIRCGNCPYFQIFIILDKLPYYQRSGELSRWETFTAHNAEKYVTLSQDDASIYFHTPNKTLIYGEFYQFNLSSCIRQQNSLTAQFVSFSLSNLANIFYPPPPIFTIINLCLL